MARKLDCIGHGLLLFGANLIVLGSGLFAWNSSEDTWITTYQTGTGVAFADAGVSDDVVVGSVAGFDSISTTLIDDVVDACLNLDDHLDISSYSMIADDAQELLKALMYSHPEIFWLDCIDYYYDDNCVLELCFTYTWDTDEIEQKRVAYERALNMLIDKAKAQSSTYEQIKYVHDYIVDVCRYDKSVVESGDEIPKLDSCSYGALIDGVAVCSGYSLLFKDVMNRLGYTSYIVTSTTMNHMWNAVEIDGTMFHVDVTYDDKDNNFLSRQFLLVSDAYMLDYEHSNWTIWKV